MSSVLASTPESSTIAMMNENGNQMKEPLAGEANEEQRNSFIFPTAPDTGVIYECQEQVIKASFGHQEVENKFLLYSLQPPALIKLTDGLVCNLLTF